jgi:NitT/TauT family transport system ATP-binding protein
MSLLPISAGFIPLVDAAPLIVAKELGFAEEEGLDLTLEKAPSWSTLRDMLVFGQIQAAHMLSTVPVASALGLLGGLPRLNALSVMSVNGTVFGISQAMAAKLEASGYGFDFADAQSAGRALATLPRPLRIGVPFALSMHAELVTLWLTRMGLTQPEDFQIQAVPPPLMAQAIGNGDLDAFCVGEPWGSVSVEISAGALLLPGSAIWSAAPEKVLAAREDWTEENPETVARLMRAVWRAGNWLSRPGHLTMLAELLSDEKYLGVSPEVLDRALSGRFMINSAGDLRQTTNFMTFWDEGATFPWKSQAAWIGQQLAQRFGLNVETSADAAKTVFRSDLYRENLGPLGADLPLASLKTEGSLAQTTEVPTVSGSMILGRNRFFDGKIYDPNA